MIPPPLELQEFRNGSTNYTQLRRRLNLPDGSTLIGSIGKLDDNSGALTLLEAYASIKESHPNTYLLWLGTGPQKELFFQAAQARGIDKCVYLLEEGTASEVICALDVFVYPRITPPDFPAPIYQALAAKKPVLASATEEGFDILVDQANCLLVPPDNPELLKEKLNLLLKDREYANKLAGQGKSMVEDHFSLEAINLKLYHFYRKLCHSQEKSFLGWF